eukprot:11655481-Alexandrium_andersonii.AAC.1
MPLLINWPSRIPEHRHSLASEMVQRIVARGAVEQAGYFGPPERLCQVQGWDQAGWRGGGLLAIVTVGGDVGCDWPDLGTCGI